MSYPWLWSSRSSNKAMQPYPGELRPAYDFMPSGTPYLARYDCGRPAVEHHGWPSGQKPAPAQTLSGNCLPHASLRQPLPQPVPTNGTGSAKRVAAVHAGDGGGPDGSGMDAA